MITYAKAGVNRKLREKIKMRKFLIEENDIIVTYSDNDIGQAKKYLKVMKIYNSEKNISQMTRNIGVPRRTFYYWIKGTAPKPINCLKWLKHYHLVPFKKFDLNNYCHRILFDIYAFMFGDGSLDKTYIELSGERKNLRAIETKIHKFFPNISTNIFKTAERACSLFIYSAYLARFLIALGCPIGDKQSKEYSIPVWVIKDKRLAKRWLETFLGNEGVKIREKRRIARIEQYKLIDLENNALLFLNQIKQMLKKFNIKNNISSSRVTYTRKKDNKKIKGYYLKISRDKLNIYRLLNTLKYRYAQHKQIENDKTLRYLRKDLISHNNRFKAYNIAQYLKKNNYRKSQVKKIYNTLRLFKKGIPWKTFYSGYFLKSFTPRYYQRRDEIKKFNLKTK